MKKKMLGAALAAVLLTSSPFSFCAGEVHDPTRTKVAVMPHPRTGRPYVAILPEENNPGQAVIFAADAAGGISETAVSRPDYRMLDWKIKDGEIPYDGPVSDRKKVYILAATLATVGVAGGIAASFAVPATAAGAATGGAGAGIYAGAGTALTAGTVSTALIQTRPDPRKDDFEHIAESKTYEARTCACRAK
jgi:hypothetical protein